MEKYTEGMDMNQFEHIPDISSYNYNYYRGLGNDILLGVSDDDYTTTWYLGNTDHDNRIGESYSDDILYLLDPKDC